jgi:hypothetical protein
MHKSSTNTFCLFNLYLLSWDRSFHARPELWLCFDGTIPTKAGHKSGIPMSWPVRNLWVMQPMDLGKALWRHKYTLQVLALPMIIWALFGQRTIWRLETQSQIYCLNIYCYKTGYVLGKIGPLTPATCVITTTTHLPGKTASYKTG